MNGLLKRLERLETGCGEQGYLPILTINDFVIGDEPMLPWPDTVAGVRFYDGTERIREPGENVTAFRHRLSVEHGARGPGGALPAVVVELIDRASS